ncbi:helix-turn-helix domain-containing protein [Kribbella sp. GL6]|uniref:helix-turn-helix domain-containing protein n=1 Tax=Kribbella sp. GL6 TaxID=3419765 RepID=UPI003D03D9E8
MHPWIETVTLAPATTPVTVLPPDPATTVVWRMTPAGDSDVLVAGPRTTAAYHRTKDLPVCVRLRIRPGGVIPLLGTPPDQLVDQVVPLESLCGASATALAEQLVTYRNHPARAADVLSDYLTARVPTYLPERLKLVRTAVADLPGRRVDEAAARLGVSERYLRRVFRQAVGVSPKHFARIARVRRVIGTRHSWADTAAYAGYTDQSHLIADFRALMHVTPNAYATGNVPLSTC